MDIHSLSQNSLLCKVGSYLGYTVSPAEIEASERKKPANLVYDVGEVPPVFTCLMLSAQHVFVMVKGWILVVVFVTSVTGSVLSGPCGDDRIEEAVDFPDLFGTEAKFSRTNYSRNLFRAAKANNGGGHGGVP